MIHGSVCGGGFLLLAFEGEFPVLSSVTRLIGIGPQSSEEAKGDYPQL